MIFLLSLTVTGFVRDSLTGDPLPFTQIWVEGTGKGTITNDEGFFSISGVEPFQVLTVRYIGYREKKVKPSGEVMVILLAPAPIELKEVVVKSRKEDFKREIAPSKITFRRRDVERTPVLVEQDPMKSLQFLPGVTGRSDFSSQFSVRGGYPDQNLILLDGAVLYNPYHFASLFSIFDPSAIRKMEFFPGNFPVEFGERLSSVLSFSTIGGNPHRIKGNLYLSLISGRLCLEGPLAGGNFLFSTRTGWFDKVLPLFKIDIPYRFYDIISHYHYEPSPETRIYLTCFLNRDAVEISFHPVDLSIEWGNRVGSFGIRKILGNYLIKSHLSYSHFLNSLSLSFPVMEMNNPFWEVNFRGRIESANEEGISAGWDASFYDFTYEMNVIGLEYNIHDNPVRVALFAKERKRSGKFLVEGGIRGGMFTSKFIERRYYWYLDPRLMLKFFLTENLALFTAGGVYHQPIVTLTNQMRVGLATFYYWIPVFGKYKPEEAYQFDLGTHSLLPWGEFILDGYFKYYPYFLISPDSVDPQNLGETIFEEKKGFSAGISLMLRKDLGRVRGILSYNLGYSLEKLDSVYRYLSFDRRHSVDFLCEYEITPSLTFVLTWIYGTGLPYTGLRARYHFWVWDPMSEEPSLRSRLGKWEFILSSPNAMRLPSYHRMDVGIRWKTTVKNLSVKIIFDIINVYNRKNVLYYFYDTQKDPPEEIVIHMLPLIPSLGVEVRF